MGFDLLIFDFDGTLVDTRLDITNSANDMLSRYGLPLKGVHEVTSYVGDGIRRLVERCIDAARVDVGEATAAFRESYARRLLENTRPYPGVLETLERLSGKTMAIQSNKAYVYTKAISDALGLTSLFNMILGGDSVENKKPSTEGVEKILARTRKPKSGAAMIGDSANDILTAKNAGIASVFVTYGFNRPESVAGLGPDFTIDDPLQLLGIC